MSFLKSINNNSKKFDNPFTHWELNKPLTEEQVNEIVNADIANPIEYNLNYDGTRAIDGGEGSFRKGIVDGGMTPKTECCIRALAQGVKAAHIIDGRIEHSLLLEIFTNSGIGTMINA